MYNHNYLLVCYISTFSLVTSPSQVSAQCQKWFLSGSIHCAKASCPLILGSCGINSLFTAVEQAYNLETYFGISIRVLIEIEAIKQN